MHWSNIGFDFFSYPFIAIIDDEMKIDRNIMSHAFVVETLLP